MAKLAKKEKQPEPEPQPQEPQLNKVALSSITTLVLDQLGSPPNLDVVKVKPLWGDFYRVNVWCCSNKNNPLSERKKITDSFFIYHNPEKGVTRCSPPINKKY